MKLLVDMNLSPAWVDILQAACWQASHWSTRGNPSAPDAEIMDIESQIEPAFYLFSPTLCASFVNFCGKEVS